MSELFEELIDMLLLERKHTYRSGRRDGQTRRRAAWRFAREAYKGIKMRIGLDPKYDKEGRAR